MDEKRLILAAVLSLGVIAVWQLAFPPAPVQAPTELTETSSGSAPERSEPPAQRRAAEETVAPADASGPAWGSAAEEAEVALSGEGYRAVVSNRGAELTSYELSEHVGSSGGALEMVRHRSAGPRPYGLVDPQGRALVGDKLFVVSRPSDDVVEMRWSEGSRWIEKVFRFGDQGLVNVEIRADLGEPWRVFVGPGVRNPSSAEEGQQYQVKEALWRADGTVERVVSRKMAEPRDVPMAGLEWTALDDTYFLTAVLQHPSIRSVVMLPTIRRERGGGAVFDPLLSPDDLRGGEKKAPRDLALLFEGEGEEIRLESFWGGKERHRLAEVGHGLSESIDWGFFGLLSRPLHSALLWLHAKAVPNFGWAIVIMTILIKIVLLPLTHASHVSMQKMQEVNPKAQAIRAKYKGKSRDKDGRFNVDSQRRMNEEMQALYKEAGVNPLGGCLPMLAQIPVFFAFFRLLPLAIELRQAPWLGWIQDLSAADPYYLLPVIMGATQLVQMKLTPAAADPVQRRIMQMFPIVFTVFSLGFPSGLVLYWLTNNIFTIVQISAYNRIKARAAAKG